MKFARDMLLLSLMMTCCCVALAFDFMAKLAMLPVRLVMGNDAVNKIGRQV